MDRCTRTSWDLSMGSVARRRLRVLLAVLVVASTIGAASLVGGITFSLGFLAAAALFMLPGLPWAIAWYGAPSVANPTPLVVGFALGMAISSILNAILVYCIGWTVWPTVGLLVVVAIPGFLYLGFRPSARRHPVRTLQFQTADYAFLLGATLLLLVLVSIPLMRVGRLVDGEHQFPSLLAHDYLMRCSHTSSALRGLPADSIYMAGRYAPLYYLHYAFHAFVIHGVQSASQSTLDGVPPTHMAINVGNVYLSVIFLISLLICARAMLPSRFASYAAVTCGLFVYSYKAFYVGAKYLLVPLIPSLHHALQERGLMDFTNISIGWYRDLLVEPQAVLALILFLPCFIMVVMTFPGKMSRTMAAGAGILLAGSFCSDAIVGTIGVLWFVVFASWMVVRARPQSRFSALIMGLLVLGSSGIALAGGLLSGLAPFPSGSTSSGLIFAPTKVFWVLGPAYFPLEYGPLLLLASAGAWVSYRARGQFIGKSRRCFALLALGMICVCFIAFVTHSGRHESLVFRKAGKMLFLVLTISAGNYMYGLMSGKRVGFLLRHPRIVFGIALLGVATTFVDFATFAGLYDGKKGVVLQEDYEACLWLGDKIPIEAVVQGLEMYYGSSYYRISPIGAIGGRAMAAGKPVMADMTTRSKSEWLGIRAEIRSLFEPTSCDQARRVLDKYGIHYVYVGPHERAWRNGGVTKYYANPSVFENVYSRNGVDIFLYQPPQERAS